MYAAAEPGRPGWLTALRRFAREQPAVERCDLCAVGLGDEHAHLVEPAARRLLCACQACALLFSGPGNGRYRRVPRQIQRLPDFRLPEAQWDHLLVPIGLAFFYRSSPAERVVAFYPGPAGATESTLDPAAWQALVDANPVLAGLEPDVEALLVNRLGGAREYYRLPIDECYRLVGLVRSRWQGLTGGPAIWTEVAAFFDRLAAAQPELRA
jgi:hypothetical protein